MFSTNATDGILSTNRLNLTENYDKSIRFLDIPKGKDMKTNELMINNDNNRIDEIFEKFSTLTTYLFPNEYPIGKFKIVLLTFVFL